MDLSSTMYGSEIVGNPSLLEFGEILTVTL